MPAVVKEDLCIGCQSCVNACPVQTISFTEDAKAQVEQDNCISCGACIATCPMSAIEMQEN